MAALAEAKDNMETSLVDKSNHSRPKNNHPLIRRMVIGLKRFHRRFLKIRGTPQQVALGLALGVFVGMSPFLGFHTLIAVMLASLIKWSKIAAGVGVFITNPFTAPLIYPITYRLGATLTGFSESFHLKSLFQTDGLMGVLKNSPLLLVDLLIGGVVVGLPLAAITYFMAFRVITRARAHIKARKARRAYRQIGLAGHKHAPKTQRPHQPDKDLDSLDQKN